MVKRSVRARLTPLLAILLLGLAGGAAYAQPASASHLQGGFFTAKTTADGHLTGTLTYLEIVDEYHPCAIGSLQTLGIEITSPTSERVPAAVPVEVKTCNSDSAVYTGSFDFALDAGLFPGGTPDGAYALSFRRGNRVGGIKNMAQSDSGFVALQARVRKITGQANAAPVLGSNVATGISIARPTPSRLNAMDPDGGAVTYNTMLKTPPGGSSALTDADAPDTDVVTIDAAGVLRIPGASNYTPGDLYAYKVRVTDDEGDYADRDVLMKVASATQVPPTISGLAPTYTVAPGATKVITFSADDESPAPAPVTVGGAGLPSWATLTQATGNPATATLTLSPPADAPDTASSFNIDATANGSVSLTSMETVRVVVERPAPAATPTPTPAPAEPAAPAAPAPPPCEKTYTFGVTDFESAGCFDVERDASGTPVRLVATGTVKVNHLPVAPGRPGARFVLTLPTAAHPRPRVDMADAKITAGAMPVYAGKIAWILPKGDETDPILPGARMLDFKDDGIRELQKLPVAPGARLMGLPVRGTASIRVGRADDGRHFVTLPVNVELPSTFRSGPDVKAGGVTADASLRVDDRGTHYDGLRLIARQVWMGKLRVEEVCLSYLPAGGQSGEPCEAPELDGQPYVTCNDDKNVDRWDGNAVIVLPTKSQTQLAAFGGVSGGKIGKLGGFVDNLGNKVPLATGVYLNRVGVGLCLNPPPLKLRGDVGVSVFPTPKGEETLGINGSLLFTDAHDHHPWSLEIGGSVEVFDKLIGTGAIILRPTGAIDFRVASGVSLLGVVSVNGRLEGWLETRTKKFNVEGRGRACLTSLCTNVDAIASSTGMGGCGTVASIVYYYPVRAHNWKWYAPWRINWIRGEIPIRGGFGHRWQSGNVQVLGSSCDFGPYRAQRTAGMSADGNETVRVASGVPALALSVRGAGAAPVISLRSPDGETLELRGDAPARKFADGSMIIKNDSDDSTSVLLVRPAAGTWTIRAAAGSPAIASVWTSAWQPPATVQTAVRAMGGGVMRAVSTYTVPDGATLSLVEKGAGAQRTLVKRVKGAACPAPASPDGRTPLCHTIDFRPADGPGGPRELVAVVERDGMPLTTRTVARFEAPRQAAPAEPARLRVRRIAGRVVVAWDRARAGQRHSVVVRRSSGERHGRMLPARCRALTLPSSAGTSVEVSIAGVREDLATSARARVTLDAGRSYAGAGPFLPHDVRRPLRAAAGAGKVDWAAARATWAARHACR